MNLNGDWEGLMKVFQVVVGAFVFVALGVSLHAQGLIGNDAITIGASRLNTTWGESYYESSPSSSTNISTTIKNAPALWLGYNHRFRSPWAIDASLLLSTMNTESKWSYEWHPNHYYSLPTLNGKIAVNSFSLCSQYHFGHNAHFDPYFGLGLNLMMSRASEEFQGGFIDEGSPIDVKPTGRGSLGWTAQVGANFRIASHLSIKAELQYIRNGVFMRRYQYVGAGHVWWWTPAGYMNAHINPFVTSVGLSVCW